MMDLLGQKNNIGMNMIDFLGKDLMIGDTCIIIEPSYRNFVEAQIVKFTKHTVKLVYVSKGSKSLIEIKQEPHQLVKI